MSHHFKEWVWIKAHEAWTKVTSFIGFEDVKVAYTQGYYKGYNQALEDVEEEGLEQLTTIGGSYDGKDEPTTP